MDNINTQGERYLKMSPTIGELARALCEAQKTMDNAKRDSLNPFFHTNYSSLASVWEACRPALVENGLAVSQLCINEGDMVGVETILMHTSGEWISNKLMLKPIKPDPQAQGSALTYARRYSLSGIVCLATEADDDGEGAMDRPQEMKKPSTSKKEI